MAKSKSLLAICILLPLAVGSLSALLGGNTAAYSSLERPALAPPAAVFPVVWTVLYILMGISSYLVYTSESPDKTTALRTYALQLFFNFFWSIIFFGFSQYFLAFLWLLALILVIAAMIYQFFQISPAAAYLQIPYLAWCAFAAWLNFMICTLN